MEVMTIKQYAENQHVSYEAVRKQIVRYGEELKDHIVKRDRKQYLDEWAVKFLTERRRENPVILVTQENLEEIEELKKQVESLRTQLMTAQNELLKSQDDCLKAKDKIIELQDEAKKTLEDKAKYTALLEDNEAKEEKLKDLERQSEEDRKKIEDLRKECDEAKEEAQSFQKSVFGLYRKVH